jgi:CheY-like chemotaxis protein
VAEALRREPAFANVRLVAVSGYGQAEDRSRAKAAGFDHHLVKPVDLRQLVSALAPN